MASRLGERLIFQEQEKDYSATLAAARKAYELAAEQNAPPQLHDRVAKEPVCYLVCRRALMIAKEATRQPRQRLVFTGRRWRRLILY